MTACRSEAGARSSLVAAWITRPDRCQRRRYHAVQLGLPLRRQAVVLLVLSHDFVLIDAPVGVEQCWTPPLHYLVTDNRVQICEQRQGFGIGGDGVSELHVHDSLPTVDGLESCPRFAPAPLSDCQIGLQVCWPVLVRGPDWSGWPPDRGVRPRPYAPFSSRSCPSAT